jgi:hypothetical protein
MPQTKSSWDHWKLFTKNGRQIWAFKADSQNIVNTSETKSTPERKNMFLQLADDITDVVVAFPAQADPLILKSAILLTMAEDASSFVALAYKILMINKTINY